jgi:hypothetical protein
VFGHVGFFIGPGIRLSKGNGSMKTARKLILAIFAVIGLMMISWTSAHLGRSNAEAGEPKLPSIAKAQTLDGAAAPRDSIPTTKCETVAWRQWVGDVTTGTTFEITKLGVDGSVYLVFTSEHGVFVVKQ